MRTKYSNPYFKNPEMKQKLLDYIERRKPKLEPNQYLNLIHEIDQPVPEMASKTGQSWVKINQTSKYNSQLQTTNRKDLPSILVHEQPSSPSMK